MKYQAEKGGGGRKARPRLDPPDQGNHRRRPPGRRRCKQQSAPAFGNRQSGGRQHAERQYPARDGVRYAEIRYEGYGPASAAIIVDCMTDNRARTVADVRHAFSKHGGNLGQEGSVVFMFRHCAQFLFAPNTPEDALMDAALKAGADDVFTHSDGSFEVSCAPNDFSAVKNALEDAGFKAEWAEATMKPLNEVEFAGADAEKIYKLMDALESLDDVQAVFSNAVFDA